MQGLILRQVWDAMKVISVIQSTVFNLSCSKRTERSKAESRIKVFDVLQSQETPLSWWSDM